MPDVPHPIFQLLSEDPRYKLDAYQFVREALAYAQNELGMGGVSMADPDPEEEEPQEGTHLTGQQLCEAIRMYGLQQYGYMAKVVLNSWGVQTTGDFGEIVYNLIEIGLMKKSDTDRRADFDDLYDFSEAFQQRFQISRPE